LSVAKENNPNTANVCQPRSALKKAPKAAPVEVRRKLIADQSIAQEHKDTIQEMASMVAEGFTDTSHFGDTMYDDGETQSFIL